MKIVVLHHHFEPGGVTQVVIGHLTGLALLSAHDRPEEIWIVHGGRHSGWPSDAFAADRFPIPVRQMVVDQLEYDALRGADAPRDDGGVLADALEARLREAGLRPDDCVLHVHNPTLGKNVSIAGMVRRLAERRWRWLLQIHDFAEDYRPANYARLIAAARATSPAELEAWLYPQSPTIHYATLASGDARHLSALGVPRERLHVVPNPVLPPPGESPDRHSARRLLDRRLALRRAAGYVLYPVRGIRRKNVGELLLWAAMRGDDYTFSITLPPATPVERHSWDRWRRLAGELRLPIIFGSGTVEGVDFATNLAAADCILTTSVAEGFGLVFLEPWLAERPLLGRDLPDVTDDFRAAGVRLPWLYERLPVAVSGRERREATDRFRSEFDAAWEPLSPSFRPAAPPSLPPDAPIDFGMLSADDQAHLVRRVVGSRREAQQQRTIAADVFAQLGSANALAAAGEGASLLGHNRETVARVYAPQRIADHLAGIYRSLLDQRAGGALQTAAGAGDLLRRISLPSRFRPIRTETKMNDSPFVLQARPLQPRPTGYPSRLDPIAGIRAVIFDIYGTLVISGSGDVGSSDADLHGEAIRPALRAVGLEVSELPEQEPMALVRRLHAVIAEHHERSRERGIAYPEVDIVAVWQQWLWTEGQGSTATRVGLVQRLAAEFEARANPSWPMPGAVDLLRRIRTANLPMGIVSNAQFFTLEMLHAALGGEPRELGFDMDLSIFSFRYGHAKPASKLFDVLVAALSWRGIAPTEAIYVGNDMLNDVAAASRAGLRSALFAGDRRSLRLREGDPRIAGCAPDVVLSDLSELSRVLGL